MQRRSQRLGTLLLSILAVLVVIGLAPAHAEPDAPEPVDKSRPYGVAGNLAENVRDDEHPAMVELIKESGAQWHREEFSWERLQPDRGAPFRFAGDGYGFLEYDDAVDRLSNAGVNILGLLAYNPAWFKNQNPPPDDWIGDWQLYVHNVVSRYGRQRGQIKHWEIWNEPNLKVYGYENGLYSVDDYLRLLRAAHEMIKAADPDATIVLGGLANIWSEVPEHYYDTFDYLERLGKIGGWPYVDVINIHAYRPGAPEGTFQRRERSMDFDDEMEELERLMSLFGSKRVWFTEVGWGSHTGPYGISEQEQAWYLVRFFAVALQSPRVERVFWYSFRNNLAYWTPYDKLLFDETVPDWHMGLIRRTYPLKTDDPTLRKPAFLAYRAMTDILGRLPLRQVVARGDRPELPLIYWNRYADSQRGADLLWQLGSGPASVTLRCQCHEARVRSWNGSLQRIVKGTAAGVRVDVPPRGEPIYVEYGPDRSVGTNHFPETGHGLSGPFLTYWRQNGGLAQFGYPITGELIEPDPRTGRARIVQYFERNRFEYFPEYEKTPYYVQLGRLGEDQLLSRGVRWQELPESTGVGRGCRSFAETGRMLCPPFRDYWERRGGLAMYGLPLTDSMIENGRRVQYFERNRFEEHPENVGTPYDILLGLLGVELYSSP